MESSSNTETLFSYIPGHPRTCAGRSTSRSLDELSKAAACRAERARITQDLHDDVIPPLLSFIYRADPALADEGRRILAQLRHLLRQIDSGANLQASIPGSTVPAAPGVSLAWTALSTNNGQASLGTAKPVALDEGLRLTGLLMEQLSPALDSLLKKCQQVELSMLLVTAQQRLAQVLGQLQNNSSSLTQTIEGWQQEFIELCSSAEISTQVHSQVTAGATLPDPHASLTLARMIREAATNIVRHSGASCARLQISVDQRRIGARVSDNGHGRIAAITPGRGLRGMKKRAFALGGCFHLGESAPGLWLYMSLPPSLPAPAYGSSAQGDEPRSRTSSIHLDLH